MGIDETIAILGFQRSGVIVGNETTSRGLERDERCVTHLTARGQTWTRCGRDTYRVPVICNTSNIYIHREKSLRAIEKEKTVGEFKNLKSLTYSRIEFNVSRTIDRNFCKFLSNFHGVIMELGYVNNNNGNSSRYLSVVRKVFEYLVHDYRVVKWNARGEVKRRGIVSVLGWN